MNQPVRWWPAILIVTAMIGVLSWIWLSDIASTQHKVIPTFPTLFFGVLLLFAWLVLFSRLPRRTRLLIFFATAVIVGLGFLTLEIKGVDGNLVPIVGWRWGGERDFDGGTGRDLDPGRIGLDRTAPAASDYPQFYGPRRLATLEGPVLATDWKARPPREIWRRAVGEGWSAFAVAGPTAVTQEQRDGRQVVVSYHLETGDQIWVHETGEAFDTTVGGRGPRTTPTVADGVVFALDATGELTALEHRSGRPLWSRNVLEDHGAGRPDWGMASSPLLVGDLVVVQLGKNGAGLAAYDYRTGEPIWRQGRDGGTYSSPLATAVLGREMILIVNRASVSGHDPTSGEILLDAPWPNATGGERISMPLVVAEDRILVSAGYGVGSRLFRLTNAGDGLTADVVWDSPRLKSKFAPMVQHEGVVYGLDDGVLVALDPATGERHWKRGRYGHGQMILVGGLLLIQAENGEVVLVEATSEEHRELTRFAPLQAKTWNPPALAGRLLLVRNNQEAACYELPVVN